MSVNSLPASSGGSKGGLFATGLEAVTAVRFQAAGGGSLLACSGGGEDVLVQGESSDQVDQEPCTAAEELISPD